MARRTKAQWLVDNLIGKTDTQATVWLEEQRSISDSERSIIIEMLQRGMLNLK